MKKRFCCWCGKVETTELCQSKSIKFLADVAVRAMAGEKIKEAFYSNGKGVVKYK